MSASGLSQLCVRSVAPFKPKKIIEEQPGQTKEQFIMRPQKERGEAREGRKGQERRKQHRSGR